MIKNLEIKNFKSIKHQKLDCRRINIFIGEPNTGKSNILEALGLISFGCYFPFAASLRRFVRFEATSNLFYDEILDENVQVDSDGMILSIGFAGGTFRGTCQHGTTQFFRLEGDHTNLRVVGPIQASAELSGLKFYRFDGTTPLGRPEAEFLLPPSGENLVSLLLKRRALRDIVTQLFSRFGLRVGLKPQEGKIEVIKHLDDIIVSYPYSLVSDTLRRLVFYLTAVLSNQDSVLIFEEPESHAFPYYTKYLAETIALDDRKNQYFVSTHNPYFLLPLLEKSPKGDVAIFITFYKDYQTRTKLLNEKEMQEVTEIDVFSNLERFLDQG